MKVKSFYLIVIALFLSSCSSINRDEFMRVSFVGTEWKKIARYSVDSTSRTYTAEYQKDGLTISLHSAQALIRNSKHGAGVAIALGPPFLPIIYLGQNVAYAALENGFTLTLHLQYSGESARIDLSKAKILLPDQSEYGATKLGVYEGLGPLQKSSSFLISPTQEQKTFEIEFALTNAEIMNSCDSFQVSIPPLIRSAGDSIKIPALQLKKKHSIKFYPISLAG